jgi:predicted O-methyltransferase YrrM
MNVVKRITITAQRRLTGHRALLQLNQLDTRENPRAARIAHAFSAAFRRDLDPAESAWVQRIEILRSQLLGMPRELEIVDYGAGDAHVSRSDEQMRQGQTVRAPIATLARASKPPFWALFLFKLVREFAPQSVIELGTCVGVSAAYQAAAQALNGSGRLITLEGAESLAVLANENLRSLGLDNATVVPGPFQDTLAEVLARHQPVEYAFIDGHHDGNATVEYFHAFLPHLAPEALLVFDDLAWSEGMGNAWQTIAAHPSTRVAIDLGTLGICVVDRTHGSRLSFRSYVR